MYPNDVSDRIMGASLQEDDDIRGLYFEIIRGILAVAEDVLHHLIEVHLLLWQNLLLREGGFFYAELFLELSARRQVINFKNFSPIKVLLEVFKVFRAFYF